MQIVLDTTRDCTAAIERLRQGGCDAVIRYYSRSKWKRLSQEEAIALGRAGIRLAIVYQNRQNRAADFSSITGEAAGRDADDYARNVIFQPKNSAIYFAVDFDASKTEIDANVAPYFEAARRSLATAAGGVPDYRVGVYGSGRVCRMISDANLAEFTWLAQARGWAEYQKYASAMKWDLKQGMPASMFGLECDPDDINPDREDFGAFLLDPASLGDAAPPVDVMAPTTRATVIARDGLRLRSGPSTAFDVRSTLTLGTIVNVLSRNGDWALVDLTHKSVNK